MLWALGAVGAVGTVGSWLAAFGSALGWRLGSVSTPDAAAWVGGSAWSRPWLYLPSLAPPMPGDIPGSFPLHDILGLPSCPPAGCSARCCQRGQLCAHPYASASLGMLWGDRSLCPSLSPGVCVTSVCPGGSGSLWELLHLLTLPFCRGILPKGTLGGGHRQAHALALPCSTDCPCPCHALHPVAPAAFPFAFPGAEGSAGVARPPSHPHHAVPPPTTQCLGTACPCLDGWQRVTRGGVGPPASTSTPHGGPLGRLAGADAPGHLSGCWARYGWQEGDQHGWGPGDWGPLPRPRERSGE